MIKALICWLWGHKTVVKAYTGKTFVTQNYAGNELSVSLYEWKGIRFAFVAEEMRIISCKTLVERRILERCQSVE